MGKILFVRAGESLSLQYHEKKEETLFVESGSCHLQAGVERDRLTVFSLEAGGIFHLKPGTLHRLTAVTDCRLFEVSTPELSDVVRLEDRYGRA